MTKATAFDIVKVTSGSDLVTARIVDELYQSIITAGTFKATYNGGEAAKVIENTQRDISRSLMS